MQEETPSAAVEASGTGTRTPVSPVAPAAGLQLTKAVMLDFDPEVGFQFQIFGLKNFDGFVIPVYAQYAVDWPYPSDDEAQAAVNHVITALNSATDPRSVL